VKGFAWQEIASMRGPYRAGDEFATVSEIFRRQAGLLCNSRKHDGGDLFVVVKSKHVGLVVGTLQLDVRSPLRDHGPSLSKKRPFH
jgi:hypothetical protein